MMICYSAKHLPRKKQCKLSQELFGYTDKSKYGKYTYERPGFLTGKKFRKLKPGCFLLDSSSKHSLLTFFKRNNVHVELIMIF